MAYTRKIVVKKIDDDENVKNLVYLMNEQLQETKKHLEKRDKQIDEQLKEAQTQTDRDKQIETLIKKMVSMSLLLKIISNFSSCGKTDISHLTESDYINCLNQEIILSPLDQKNTF